MDCNWVLESLAPPSHVALHLPFGHTVGHLVVNSGILTSILLALLSPQPPPPSSTHPSHFERSHKTTNKSSSSHTACNSDSGLGQIQGWIECGDSLIHCLLSLLKSRALGGLCILLDFWEKRGLQNSYNK